MNFEKPKKSEFWKNEKKKKIAGDIIILHMCTKNHNHMMYSSWDMQWEHFPQQPRKLKFWKNEKSIWRCHHFKLVQQKPQLNDVFLLKYGVWQTFFSHFRPFFALLPHYWPQKLKFGKNVKNTWIYYSFTHVHYTSRSYDVWFLRYKVQ